MADPYDSDSAVDQILSEAMDLHTLEQLSSLNLSGVPDDSLLPSHLESRFRKLKSFPQSNPKPLNPPHPISQNQDIPITPNPPIPTPTAPIPESPIWDETDFKPKSKSKSGYVSSSSSSSCSSSSSSLSPPPQRWCLLCSPKSKPRRVKEKKKKKRRVKERNEIDDDLDLFVSDLSKFSLKEHKKSLKRALKEQEKINREAEQVVEMAKQLSSRIEDFAIDDEKFKFK